MKKDTKILIILLLTIIYIISPMDLIPGVPFDDIIVGIIGSLWSVKISKGGSK